MRASAAAAATRASAVRSMGWWARAYESAWSRVIARAGRLVANDPGAGIVADAGAGVSPPGCAATAGDPPFQRTVLASRGIVASAAMSRLVR
jgi:hypothetical protein